MNKIIVNHGSFKVKEVELEHGTLTVGRAADNDLKLDDSAVSSHHAKLVTFFNVTYIEDLNSTNGTLVNGRPVKKYTLHTGDIVLLGKHQLLFQGARMDETAGSDSTIVMTASEKNDALATAAEMHKPNYGNDNAKPMAKPSLKMPMKQDHKEPVGKLSDAPFRTPNSRGQSPNALGAGQFSNPAGYTPAAPVKNDNPSPDALSAFSAPQQASAKVDSLERAEFGAAIKNSAVENKSVFESTTQVETAVMPDPEAATSASPSVESKAATVFDETPPAAKSNPFRAAFPEESADKININDVPAIGRISDEDTRTQDEIVDEVLAEIQAENPDNPDTSSANIYSVQALSQAAANKADAKKDFRANIPVEGDESLLIPAFAKKMSNPEAAPRFSFSDAKVSDINQHSEQKISPEIEKLFEEEEKAQAKPKRKVLEDPSVNMGEDFQGMTPVGISESNRISQYQQRAAASHREIPAVGDRTLLKQIITGDRDFSPSRNKFEIIQIVLGVVIFVIIALIAVASL